MPKQITVGLLTSATGAHVSAYLSALRDATGCGDVVLVDPDSRYDEAAQQTLGDKLTRIERNHERYLRRTPPGMALVTMEAKAAPPIIGAALEAGVHVLAEKPACVRVADFQPLKDKADAKHRYLMLALANRLNPEITAARRLLESGSLGEPYGLEMHLVADQTRLTRASYQREWFAQKARAGGGHLIWLGIHWLDLAMFVTGSSISQTAGFIANVGGQPIDVEDSAAAALRFDNGTLGTITSGYYLNRGYHSHIKVWCSKGWLLIESMKDRPLSWMQFAGDKANQLQLFDGDKNPRGYTPFVTAAVKSCAEMIDPPISAADSLRALRTVFAVYDSAAHGKAVTVSNEGGSPT